MNNSKVDLREMGGLIQKGLVISREHQFNGRNLILFKYHNKVFYNNLWNISDALLEARGIVFDKDTGEIVQRPFHKIFNVGENGQEEPADFQRTMKVNGFMCAATILDGELFVTTTGSMDSSYQQLAYKWVSENIDFPYMFSDITYLFEICDPSDPHIVEEDHGIYLLSCRNKEFGTYGSQPVTYVFAELMGAKRPNEELSNDKEGWVYYDNNGTPVAKTKTPYYLSKKAMMRMGKKQIGIMYNNPDQFKQRLDEEFYSLYDYLTDKYTEDEYATFNEQERRKIIEGYFYE